MNADLYQEPCSSFPDSFGSDDQTSISREEANRGRSRVTTRFLLPSQWQNRQVRLLRFLALERLARGLLILGLGLEGLRLTGDPSASLRQWNLVVKQLSRINSNFADAILHSSIYEGFIKLLHVQTSTWLVIFSALLLYGLLICIEGVGLWFDVLWAEKLTVISTSAFIPLEIYELIKGFSLLKFGAFAINVFLVIWLYKNRWAPHSAKLAKD